MSTQQLEYTPLDEIDRKIQRSVDYYHNRQRNLAQVRNPSKHDLQFRELQLKKLYYAVKDNEQEIVKALQADFHRSPLETIGLEYCKLVGDILNMLKGLKKWVKPEKVADNSPPFMFGKIVIEKASLGSVLVISPFNFPVMLGLTPVAGAIAGGNSVILKPSELTPCSARICEKIIREANLDENLVQIVQGAVPETTRLLECGKFSKIFYTGSPAVGSIVAEKAAKSLTPCVLELGGKSPVYITENFSNMKIETALKRIYFGKFGNAGQICVAPDYMLVHESKYEVVLQVAKKLLEEFWPGFNQNTDYTHMVNFKAYSNTVQKLKTTKGQVYTPNFAEPDEISLCIPPSVISNVDWADPLMMEENFGPVLPLIKYSNLDDALDNVIKYHDTPLVQYIFSDSKADIDHILTRVRSGDCLIGDTMMHVGINNAPFGGIGNSGYGSYGGVFSFKAFTHERIVFKQPFWMDFLLTMRYPPFTESKLKLMKLASEPQPWFNRDGTDKLSYKKVLAISSMIVLTAYIVNGLQ
ncbi:hypothetical protein Kpol_297p11 [Vanderwaltozyma polyspora DSM 70294]|uniref:Aldehyde dehydrogenase n=1 Tax=Vanderwaltozyma polyspora (strain ATCC 22028 / DSM 70294 / BCRC 21397 / CBS 2163 / NBRC 10782 / NRRL Y-8283 / UCD 57-17) TaxID=436907 RepID=A7TSL5_VANPO|nr:uncharacterized protein Kpol_297p11 [Vanderwaltozyma polyspora DSM 70294]EDO14750.1 hypothetical protein Kpol_297p11 [Vanderwaltozyma polyspora DSM 70294]